LIFIALYVVGLHFISHDRISSCCFYFCFFFFSSRRRHTRSLRDWSSDVCSSDLASWSRHDGLRGRARGVPPRPGGRGGGRPHPQDRKSTRLNSSHVEISYAVFCLKKKKQA